MEIDENRIASNWWKRLNEEIFEKDKKCIEEDLPKI